MINEFFCIADSEIVGCGQVVVSDVAILLKKTVKVELWVYLKSGPAHIVSLIAPLDQQNLQGWVSATKEKLLHVHSAIRTLVMLADNATAAEKSMIKNNVNTMTDFFKTVHARMAGDDNPDLLGGIGS